MSEECPGQPSVDFTLKLLKGFSVEFCSFFLFWFLIRFVDALDGCDVTFIPNRILPPFSSAAPVQRLLCRGPVWMELLHIRWTCQWSVLPVELEEVDGSSEEGEEVEEVEGGDTGRTPWLLSSSWVADWTSPPVRLRAASDTSLSKPKYNNYRDTEDRGQFNSTMKETVKLHKTPEAGLTNSELSNAEMRNFLIFSSKELISVSFSELWVKHVSDEKSLQFTMTSK